MQPIHLAIGLIEGLVTFSVVTFVWKARPEILESAAHARPFGDFSLKPVLAGLGVVTILTAGMLSWFASSHPDGLEWSMGKTSGKTELEAPAQAVYGAAKKIQQTTAVFRLVSLQLTPNRRAVPPQDIGDIRLAFSFL